MSCPFTDPATAPGKPEVLDYDKDYVSLKWTPPKNDGGSPVKSYVIEKKQKYADWQKVRLSERGHGVYMYMCT